MTAVLELRGVTKSYGEHQVLRGIDLELHEHQAVALIGASEAFRQAQVQEALAFNFTPLMAAALLYLCVTIPFTRIVDHLQLRQLREQGGVLALGPH